MSSFQDILDRVAFKIGGTAPDAVNNPHFYSGYTVGDSTGVTGIHACYSVPPGAVQDPPFGVLIPGSFTVNPDRPRDLLMQGEEYNVDDIRLQLLVRENDFKTQYANLTPYRDLVPAVLRATTRLGTPVLLNDQNILQVWIPSGKAGVFTWAGTEMIGWEFVIRLLRMLPVTYTS